MSLADQDLPVFAFDLNGVVLTSYAIDLPCAPVGKGARITGIMQDINDAPVLLRNQTASGNHWLGIRLVGRASNRDGLGARITAAVGARTLVHEVHGGGSYLSQSDLRAHFGLGPETSVKSLTVRWPSGTSQRLDDVPADRFIVLDEKAGVLARPDAAGMR